MGKCRREGEIRVRERCEERASYEENGDFGYDAGRSRERGPKRAEPIAQKRGKESRGRERRIE